MDKYTMFMDWKNQYSENELIKEHALYDFSYFKFVETCFMGQHMVYSGECYPCAWEDCILLSLCGGFYR